MSNIYLQAALAWCSSRCDQGGRSALHVPYGGECYVVSGGYNNEVQKLNALHIRSDQIRSGHATGKTGKESFQSLRSICKMRSQKRRSIDCGLITFLILRLPPPSRSPDCSSSIPHFCIQRKGACHHPPLIHRSKQKGDEETNNSNTQPAHGFDCKEIGNVDSASPAPRSR
ncbi:hypothetical protein F5882DRAFT_177739 [Hyaloscypha sp. PMI_1271]|nr:hypothetical protein F5882DRAFT_177739 [Hyaloscypha sp. PMI_1271]